MKTAWIDDAMTFLHLPEWARVILVILAALGGVGGGVIIVGKVGRGVVRQLKPRVSAEQRQRVVRRGMFARHLAAQLDRLNDAEEWRDQRYAELEAEVEAEGARRHGWLRPRRRGLRLERSLSEALRRSRERLILMEGDPGSGKSVALRHVAHRIAEEVKAHAAATSQLALYLNLKELRTTASEIDAGKIREFVLESLMRTNNVDVARYLDEDFESHLIAGGWLFLFDSFDEIPALLAATELDDAVRQFASAIESFVSFSGCRAVIGSRHFRSPSGFGWARFRVVPLSHRRRRDLVRRALLPPQDERVVLDGLPGANPDLRKRAENPMFLGLLCEFVRAHHALPSGAHEVHESYVDERFRRDADRIRTRFHIEPSFVRLTAERAAYCMTAYREVGLEPRRPVLLAALEAAGWLDPETEQALNALAFIKLARTGDDAESLSETLTFAHRRFQEYFATAIVLREVTLVPSRSLLVDAAWRETAVAIVQTRPASESAPLLRAAARLLRRRSADAPLLVFSHDSVGAASFGSRAAAGLYSWPPDLLHILSIVAAGAAGQRTDLPAEVRDVAGRLLVDACVRGQVYDRKWALEVAAGASVEVNLWMLRQAFASGSPMLRNIAYEQVGRLAEVPTDLAVAVRKRS